ncbi:hypothetical protein OOK39_02320 [Streptomyces sp. NBC_00264]|uniref:hypothetical protein n=1 Tax=unclassified Streptomyces TaxID=2593676 RepID=UPI00224F6045|nr:MULTISPECIES: hypothetical protein [unclassified Streptomyces]MCX5158136.1 hypothetical protein [Streptomyces sp. NBC_00305]MCX5216659.1 hypothetical protein [Streptomyces sp. NBC_00264]
MATRQITCHIASCDVCDQAFDEANEVWCWDDTPALALAQVDENPDWTRFPDGRVVCPRSDTAHDLARGGESPALLRPGPDSMRVEFAA